MTSRKAHVYRIYPTDADGNITDTDIWLDVLRIDRIVFDEPRGSPDGESHIDRTYVVLWGDNTVGMGPSPPAPTKRVYEPLTVTQPPAGGGDPNNPALASIDIPLIQRTWFTYRGSEQGFAPQDVQWVFKNSNEPTGRKTTPLRITNNDLDGLDKQFFLPVKVGDPQPPTPPDQQVSWDDYLQALQNGQIDQSQYVDIEVTDRFEVRFPPSPFDQTADTVTLFGQTVAYVMKWRRDASGDPAGVEDWFDSPPESDGADTNTPGGFWRTDPFQCIVNVSWSKPVVFLYSGADGMFGSSDGVDWQRAPSSVPAIGLAWIDNVWMAIGFDSRYWTSTDGAKTWQEGDFALTNVVQVAAARPGGVGPDGKKKKGVFCAVGSDDSFDNVLVYISSDLGKSWTVALTIPVTVGATGYESFNYLSGCGGAFFVGTTWGANQYANGDGKVYTCTDGETFDTGVHVFGPGTDWPNTPTDPPPYPYEIGCSAHRVGYDQSTGIYTLTGGIELTGTASEAAGSRTNNTVYVQSGEASFGPSGLGTTFYQTFDGNIHGPGIFTASGDSMGFATGGGFGLAGLPLLHQTDLTDTGWSVVAPYISGGVTDLLATSDPTDGVYAGSACFKGKGYQPGEAVVTKPKPHDPPDDTAMFALAAFSTGGQGGVYVAAPGQSLVLTHPGTLIASAGPSVQYGAAVATGALGFLKTTK